jgi:catechol 2,3-dioxygenase-like lactoylglutathione lyase family enzyme
LLNNTYTYYIHAYINKNGGLFMPIPDLSFILLFVENPQKSVVFYSKILGLEPIEQSATFAMFALPNGLMLGLWSPTTAEPKVTAKAGACEICFSEENVDSLYDTWLKLGITIAQTPTDMDFGRTFVALDPDGHRIRVYRLSEGNS